MSTRFLCAALVVLCITVPFAAEAETGAGEAGDEIRVILDQAKVMRIAAPAATIIIGNPAIADATMQDQQTLVITGRTYGTTNLIILDGEGEPITDTQIVVEGPTLNRVTVYRGVNRFSYSCGGACEAAVVPGDANDFFGNIQSQAGARAGVASGQAAQAQ